MKSKNDWHGVHKSSRNFFWHGNDKLLFDVLSSDWVIVQTGTERSSMQAVFHVQYYSVHDGQVIWDAEFEDMILINQKNQRILDPSRLSSWRSV